MQSNPTHLTTHRKPSRSIGLLGFFFWLVLSFAASPPQQAAADSPLTSTTFSTVYARDPLVALAAKGELTEALAQALSDPATPSDVRAAIINALGWNIDGQTNAARYLAYLEKTHKAPPSTLKLSDLSAQESFALGYLLAMDHYLDLSPISKDPKAGPLATLKPQEILADACTKAPKDFTVALITGLVSAQHAMDSDWCQVFKRVDEVIKQPWPVRNINDKATAIILDYVALYAPECQDPKPIQGP